MPTPAKSPQLAQHPFLSGTRHARSVLAALATTARPARLYMVGTSGSGKSVLLQDLAQLLADRGVPLTWLDRGQGPLELSPEQVLFVDDLHLLDPARVDAIRSRAADPSAGLIVACRPWPGSKAMTEISRRLARSSPAIVLGEVPRSDVQAFLVDIGQRVSDSCLDRLLGMTSGVAWLVSRALACHDERDCASDPQHLGVRRALEAEIVHRLDTVDEPLRRVVELLSFGRRQLSEYLQDDPAAADEYIAQGHAEGLLLRSGDLAPVVRSAVCAATPAHRIAEFSTAVAETIVDLAGDRGDLGHRTWPGVPQVGAAVVDQADQLLDTDPRRAAGLYDYAVASGVNESTLTLRRALAAWGSGDLDAAAGFMDVALGDSSLALHDGLADAAAALWAARGMLETGSDVYEALPPRSAVSSAKAAITHIGAGLIERSQPTAPPDDSNLRQASSRARTGPPSTLSVAMRLLEAGLRSSLMQDPPASTLGQLVRASELYSSSRATDPLAELPAIVASAVAVGAGDLMTARTVIDAAVNAGQGGEWARARLLLWQSWVAIQGERPADAREAFIRAQEIKSPRSPRDEMLLQTIRVALARRYEDVPSLEATWQTAREGVRQMDFDLYTLLPLSSLIAAAARVGDSATLAPHLAHGLSLLKLLGSPPLWSTHLRWACVQQGILLNRPDSLVPHARALVAAAQHSHVAETMAQAGNVWVAVLGKSVDPDAVEAAARALAGVGLAWDGARLAGHGAGRTDDRRVAARLLACARELHPQDSARQVAPAGEKEPDSALAGQLSERELDVARLVIQGKTYAEIGETIFISPRTVEHHMASIKRRLDATSRSELISKLRLAIEPPVTESSPTPDGGGRGANPHNAA